MRTRFHILLTPSHIVMNIRQVHHQRTYHVGNAKYCVRAETQWGDIVIIDVEVLLTSIQVTPVL